MKMARHFAGLIPAAVFFTISMASARDTGRIQGRVVDEAGTPIAGATVAYSSTPKLIRTRTGSWRLAPGEREVSGEIATAPDGTFAVSNLPDGSYGMCAVAKGFLSTCDWFGPAGAKIVGGQTADAGRIVLSRGALIQIRVNDSARLLTDPTRSSSSLILGVRRGVRFTAAGQVSKDSEGRTFAVMVPYDVPLQLWVHSRSVRLADRLGAALDSRGANLPFSVPSGTAPAGFTLNVQERLAP